MSLLSVAITHRTATFDQLGDMALSRDQCREVGQALVGAGLIDEALVLSTCNRTEVYVNSPRFHEGLDQVIQTLAGLGGLDAGVLGQLCSVRYEDAAVEHCFTMVAGLDAMVIGENQVLGQVRAALTDAQTAATSGPVINALFQTALRVAKRVHSETRVGSAGRSVFTAAMDEVRLDPDGLDCLVVGAGQLAGLAARTLAARGGQVTCVNRTLAHAQRLAQEINGRALPMSALPTALSSSDLVISCTGSAEYVVTPETLGVARPIAVVDLALPADVDPAIRDAGVHLVSLSDLGDRLADERVDIESARSLVAEEQHRFLARQRAARVVPTVVALRQMADDVIDAELARFDHRNPTLDDATRAEVAHAVHRVVDKLLHRPTVAVQREAALDGENVDYAAVLRTLFALESRNDPAPAGRATDHVAGAAS